MPRPTRRQLRRARRGQGDQFLAALSHEFRTPLNGVLGMAGLLESTRLTAEQRAYAAALRECGEHLLTLVNDVLDFAKLGAGKVELHPSRRRRRRPAARRLRAALPARPRQGPGDRLGRAAGLPRDPRRRGPPAPDPAELGRQRREVHRRAAACC